MQYFEKVIIFGGSGFIGMHFAEHLLSLPFPPKQIILADMLPPQLPEALLAAKAGMLSGVVSFIAVDVRQEINLNVEPSVTCIANFAAVHREPGHAPEEYYQTNLRGAENVTQFAEKVDCNFIVFTSSIAPYGPTEEPKNELSLTTPETAYGCSKLVAEKIHFAWMQADKNRKLIILRPGVVYGPGENGNVTRMVKAIKAGYFFYCGNKNKLKSAVYIKELCRSITWVAENKLNRQAFFLYNMSLPMPPTIQVFSQTIQQVLSVNSPIFSLPYGLLYRVAQLLTMIFASLNIKHPFDPMRIKKLKRSNNIIPQALIDAGYEWQYDLRQSLEDWKKMSAKEW
jgi:nucleoside-diphosphate-sugar epimerase